MDQVSPACDPWSSATLRPPPAASLLGRVPSVVVTVVASLHGADPVGTYRCVMEQGRALRGRVPRGQPFEGVEQDVVGERHLIRREFAFEHALVGAKLRNAVCHEGRHCRGQLIRADGRGPLMPVKPQAGHADAPSLRETLGHAATAARPRRQVVSTSSSQWPYRPTRVKPPNRPLALAAASPWTNSTSPTGRSSTGPSGRYMARVSINTVARTLWPQCTSATSSCSRYRW